MKKAYPRLTYPTALLISIVYGFSLSLINLPPQAFLTFVFAGYLILGLVFGFIFRKSFMTGLGSAFSLSFLGWIIAVALFWSISGVPAFIQTFSEGLLNVLTPALLFSLTATVGALFAALVLKLRRFITKRTQRSLANV